MSKLSVEQKGTKTVVINRLTTPEAINERELNSIASGSVDGLLPLDFEKRKKDSYVKSTITSMLPLRTYVTGIVSKKMFLDLIIQVIQIVKNCEKHLMNGNNLCLSLDYIFIEPRTKEIKCILWPVVNNQLACLPSAFFGRLTHDLTFNKHEDISYVEEYNQFLRTSNPFSINGFERFIYELSGKTPANTHIPGSTSFGVEKRNSDITSGKSGDTGNIAYDPRKYLYPILIRTKTGQNISVDKPRFRIGKEKQLVDFFISDNSAISRCHAEIISKYNRYFIIDQNSTNKTYINGQRILPYQEMELFHGADIKLGDEEFTFKI